MATDLPARARVVIVGGGFGGVVHPLGVYVVRQGRARFVPAYEGTVLVMGVLSLLRLLVSRRRART